MNNKEEISEKPIVAKKFSLQQESRNEGHKAASQQNSAKNNDVRGEISYT